MTKKKVEFKKGAVKAPAAPVKAPAAKVEAPAPAPVVMKPKGFVIAPGKALTSLKGILGPGAKVLPSYFQGGQKTFDKWCERGYIVEAD